MLKNQNKDEAGLISHLKIDEKRVSMYFECQTISFLAMNINEQKYSKLVPENGSV